MGGKKQELKDNVMVSFPKLARSAGRNGVILRSDESITLCYACQGSARFLPRSIVSECEVRGGVSQGSDGFGDKESLVQRPDFLVETTCNCSGGGFWVGRLGWKSTKYGTLDRML